jgi:hypothetical protein
VEGSEQVFEEGQKGLTRLLIGVLVIVKPLLVVILV